MVDGKEEESKKEAEPEPPQFLSKSIVIAVLGECNFLQLDYAQSMFLKFRQKLGL